MIRNLKESGISNREIAKELGVSRNTVSKMLKKTKIQDKKKKNRGSKLDPYRERIKALIVEHNLSAIRILEEIRKLGYNGGYTILKDYCATLKKDRRILAVYRYETGPGKQSKVDFMEKFLEERKKKEERISKNRMEKKRRLKEKVSLEAKKVSRIKGIRSKIVYCVFF